MSVKTQVQRHHRGRRGWRMEPSRRWWTTWLRALRKGEASEWSAFKIIRWLMSAALISSLVRCDVRIRKSERVTQLGRHGWGPQPRAAVQTQQEEFLKAEKVSEGKNVYVKLARKQIPRQTRVPVVHGVSHVKHGDDKYEKSLWEGRLPNQMFLLERRTNQGFR